MRPETIGVMGEGVVGGCLTSWLRGRGYDVQIFDPAKGHKSIDALDEAPVVFVCVPTPYTPGVGFDDAHLLDAVARLSGSRSVVIKSTVLPGTTDLLQSRYPQHRFMFNPEFLREATALQDFIYPDRQIVGCAAGATETDAREVLRLLPDAPFVRICGAGEAEMAKYAANSFLAIKVSYANELFDLCERLRVDYEEVRDMVAADARIGASHMDVQHGGYRGYGGKCLPKDSKSLLDLAKSVGVEMGVLMAADRANARLRPEAQTAASLRLLREAEEALEERAA